MSCSGKVARRGMTRDSRPMDEPLDLDLSGLKCPLPVLRTRKALAALPAGLRLRVVCTDPLAGIDIPHLVRQEGGRLEAQQRDGAAWVFVIQRAPPDEA